MEIWKDIEGTDGYIQVSNMGRVRSLLRGSGRILKTSVDQKGYARVSVTINRKKKTYKVHREVAKAFIPNSKNLPQVNHIDGNKENNCVSNLEWVTNQENAHHAIRTGLWKNVYEASLKENERRKKKIISVNIETGERKLFDSISSAEREYNSRHICDVLKGKRNSVKGFTFIYA